MLSFLLCIHQFGDNKIHFPKKKKKKKKVHGGYEMERPKVYKSSRKVSKLEFLTIGFWCWKSKKEMVWRFLLFAQTIAYIQKDYFPELVWDVFFCFRNTSRFENFPEFVFINSFSFSVESKFTTSFIATWEIFHLRVQGRYFMQLKNYFISWSMFSVLFPFPHTHIYNIYIYICIYIYMRVCVTFPLRHVNIINVYPTTSLFKFGESWSFLKIGACICINYLNIADINVHALSNSYR